MKLRIYHYALQVIRDLLVYYLSLYVICCHLLVANLMCDLKCGLETEISLNVAISAGAHDIDIGKTWEIGTRI